MAGIQKYYVDALGERHVAPDSTVGAIEAALHRLEPETDRRGGPRTVVTTVGSRLRVGPSEIRLEDGSSLTVDTLLPSDVPAGYHEIQTRGSGTKQLIVAPAVCHLPRAFRTWGWAIQLYAARSRRSWGIGDLADLRWLGRWADA